MKKALPSILFTSIIALLSIIFLFASSSFPLAAGMYPWIMGSVVLFTCLLLLALDIRRAVKGQAAKKGRGLSVESEYDYGVPASEVAKRYRRSILWILSLCAAIWLVGFKVGVPVWIGVYVGFVARLRWFVTLGSVVLAVLFLFYFDIFLHAFWPEGILKSLLPWLP